MTGTVSVRTFLDQFTLWAMGRLDLVGAALVGSWARGDAREESDVDLVILVREPKALISDSSWYSRFGRVESEGLEDYGRLVSRRVRYEGGLDVEFGIAAADWATSPDEGSLRVLREGFRILVDREGVLDRLSMLMSK